MQSFSKEFYIGAATAAHQVEGNNIHSDFWSMEQMKYSTFTEPSLDAVDHYNRYQEDIRLMAGAGLNSYRFSLEWARIEPQEGVFDDTEAEHYLDVIRFCKEQHIEPIVTLHHFSSPKWLISKGGWENPETISFFTRYVDYIIRKIGSEINFLCTINEANMGLQIAEISKRYRQQMMALAAQMKENPSAASKEEGSVQIGLDLQKMMENQRYAAAENKEIFGIEKLETFTSERTAEGDAIVCRAHEAARDLIKKLYPDMKVGLTLSLHDLQTVEGGEQNALEMWTDEFLHYLPYIQKDDFLGVQNYSRSIIGPEGSRPVPAGSKLTQMNYEYYPQALEHVIRKVASSFPGDLIITENGVAVDDDTDRVAFIQQALQGVQNCLADSIPIKGYFYWSLMDNFEWQKGYSMTFGLIAVDRSTQQRIPKESLHVLGSYCGRD
ncbi:MAG: glycoside hydrolase family 1 protein [Lachnospiraceae bacterium]